MAKRHSAESRTTVREIFIPPSSAMLKVLGFVETSLRSAELELAKVTSSLLSACCGVVSFDDSRLLPREKKRSHLLLRQIYDLQSKLLGMCAELSVEVRDFNHLSSPTRNMQSLYVGQTEKSCQSRPCLQLGGGVRCEGGRSRTRPWMSARFSGTKIMP